MDAWTESTVRRTRVGEGSHGCEPYILDVHFDKRCRERRYSIFDAKRIAVTAKTCEPYPEAKLLADGTSWRVFGQDRDGEMAALGVEAFLDNFGRQVLLITIMDAT